MLMQDIRPVAITAFRDVLAPVVNAAEDEVVLRAADELCTLSGGRFTALLAPPLPGEFYAVDPATSGELWSAILTEMRTESARQFDLLRTRVAKTAAASECRTAALDFFLARESVVMSARHADLAIVQRPSGRERTFRNDLLEGVLFQSGRPVLVIPPTQARPLAFRRILIAWNASREAARAVGDAAPILDQAERVTILTVDAAPATLGPGEASGAALAAHLAYRGVRVDVRNVDGKISAAEAITDVAREIDADAIVLGAYGHARLREFVFGGVTRGLLGASDRPLFMSH
jgi:nucleotide-binding universal stress UspA family protein